MFFLYKAPDHLIEEKKVEEKKKPNPKKKKQEEEEPEIIPPNPLDILANLLQSGNRILTALPLHYNLPQLLKTCQEYCPAPIYPDPGKNQFFFFRNKFFPFINQLL